MNDHLDELAQLHQCPYCGEYGWCRTTSGALTHFLHAARTDPVRLAFCAGFEEGLRERT